MVYRSSEKEIKRRKKIKIGPLIALVFLIAISVSAYVTLRYIKKEVNGEFGDGTQFVIDVPEGASTNKIAELLKNEGIIKNELIFRGYVKFFSEKTPKFMYGPHDVTSGMSYDELIMALEVPAKDTRETIRFTFAEGYTALRMGLYLEQIGFCSLDEWLSACNEETYDVPFWNEISDDENKFIKLEGFLYPDTYEFFEDATPVDVVKKMLENFESKVLNDAGISELISKSEYSLEEIIIFASLIEKESGDENEIYKVSSVFHNRLEEGSPFPSLQSCATRNYADYVLDYYYGDIRGEETPEEMRYLYNTYESSGLMVGAICNPSVISIKAVLVPEDTPYYFFLMDDTGKTYYGVTYNEHLANIAEMRKVNANMVSGIGE
ncbi:MAG: endolytic transglycosylase MltG [Ruminococcaceae bacterium]|nr:endolytic transglycosylase MltG [Oscillospiraceae bacterium]